MISINQAKILTKAMENSKSRETYVKLLAKAENANGRKEVVSLIHKADKERMKREQESHSS